MFCRCLTSQENEMSKKKNTMHAKHISRANKQKWNRRCHTVFQAYSKFVTYLEHTEFKMFFSQKIKISPILMLSILPFQIIAVVIYFISA